MSFLISSQRNIERDALSELFYVLSDVLKYNVRPLRSRVPGLSILSLIDSDKDIFEAIGKIRDYIMNKGPLIACLKIVPLERLIKTNISSIANICLSLAQEKILSTYSWRINVNKRQTNLKTLDIIDTIAKKIDWGNVDLENPEYEIRVEVIRDLTGISVMQPHFELRKVDWIPED